MQTIEQEYRKRIAALSGPEKIARVEGLLTEVRDMLRRRIEREIPGLNEEAIRVRIARSLYRTEPAVQRLLNTLER